MTSVQRNHEQMVETINTASGGLQVAINKHRQVIEEGTKNLVDCINKNADASDKLSGKIWWLNVVITIATVAMAIIAYLDYIKP